MVGADGSAAAMTAIDASTRLADPNRVEVVVRTVIPPAPLISTYAGGVVPNGDPEEFDEQAREAARADLDLSLQRLRDAGFAARGSLGHGWPAVDLMDRVEGEGSALVVVGAPRVGASSE